MRICGDPKDLTISNQRLGTVASRAICKRMVGGMVAWSQLSSRTLREPRMLWLSASRGRIRKRGLPASKYQADGKEI